MFPDFQTHRELMNKTPLVLWHGGAMGFSVSVLARVPVVAETHRGAHLSLCRNLPGD
jgi:hypothetical protein